MSESRCTTRKQNRSKTGNDSKTDMGEGAAQVKVKED